MKITDVETMVCSSTAQIGRMGTGREVVIMKVHTDEGITGLGYLPTITAHHGGHAKVAQEAVNGSLKTYLIGQDPLANERLWENMFMDTYRWGRSGIVVHAIAALDVALWDIKGKVAGLPLYKLLGAYRERVPVYANAGFEAPPDQIARKAVEMVGQGFTGVKVRVGLAVVPLDEATERVKAIREAVGPDIRLMCDANASWDVDTAIKMLRKWEKHNIHWLEEPLHPDDILGYIKLTQSVATPITAGENHCTRTEFRELITRGAVRIIQPDAIRVGGITEWLKVAGMASSFGIPVAPHSMNEIHVHLVAAHPAGIYVEVHPPGNPMYEFIHSLFKFPKELTDFKDSAIAVPQAPGLGLELNEEAAAKSRVA